MQKKYFTTDTYKKFDPVTNSIVEDQPLMFPPEELRGETTEQQIAVYGANAAGAKAVPLERVGRMETCTVCNHEFRITEMVQFRGKWYCKPSLHIREIASILKLENESRNRPRQEREIGNPNPIIDQSLRIGG